MSFTTQLNHIRPISTHLKDVYIHVYLMYTCYKKQRVDYYQDSGAYEPPEGRKERPTAWNGI